MENQPSLPQLLEQAVLARNTRQFPHALHLIETALKTAPQQPDCLHLKALILADLGHIAEAVQVLQTALATAPRRNDIRANLARLLQVQAEPQQALDLLLKETSHSQNTLALISELAAEVKDWVTLHHVSVALAPHLTDPQDQLACIANRATASLYLGRYHEVAEQHLAQALAVGHAEAAATAIFFRTRLSQFDGPQFLADAKRAAARFQLNLPPLKPQELDPNRKLRIGYVGQQIATRLMAYQVTPTVLGMDPAEMEVVLFHTTATIGDEIDRLSHLQIVDLSQMSCHEAAQEIQRQEIDILVNWGVHTLGPHCWLETARLAPIQTSIHFCSSGLDEMDVLICDANTVPIDSPSHRACYSEAQLIRLPECYQPWQPPTEPPAATSLPALKKGYLTFGSCNDLQKLTDETLGLWRKILAALPTAQLIIKANGLDHPNVRRHFEQRLIRLGLDPTRCQIMGSLPEQDHLALFGDIDIMLDSTPYAGALSTLDAFYHGVPVVSLAGTLVSARIGSSYLNAVDLGHLAVETEEAYVKTACALAQDLADLSALRADLPNRLQHSAMADIQTYCKIWTNLLRQLWRDYCAKTPASNEA